MMWGSKGGLEMPKELPGYRDQLESVIAAYPEKECLTVRETAKFTGFTEKTAAKKFPFVGHGLGRYITRTSLARALVSTDMK